MKFLLDLLIGIVGYGWGVGLGILVGYLMSLSKFPKAPPVPVKRRLCEHKHEELEKLLTQTPLWIKQPDWDRVLWLNHFLAKTWPCYNEAITKAVRAAVEPLIEQYRPWYISSVEVATLDLGTFPPVIDSVTSIGTVDHEMIIQALLRWASNANVRLRIRSYGISISVQLSEIVVSSTARAIFKPLVYTFPCFSGITVTMLRKPTVDFSLKLENADFMALPGLYHFVQHIIKKVVAELLLFPRKLEVWNYQVASSTKRPVGTLYVRLIEAKDLKKTDLLGKSDPFVELSVGLSRKIRSSVKQRTLNPVWDEQFSFLVEDPQEEILTLHLFDEDVGTYQKVGICQFPLNEITPNEPKDVWLDVKKDLDPHNPKNQKYRGQIHIEATYRSFKGEDEDPIEVPGVNGSSADGESEMMDASKAPPGGGLLTVLIDKGNDLVSKRGVVNPYVKVRLRTEKRTTQMIKKNADPEWNENFEFLLDEPPLEEVLHIEVWHKSVGISKLFSRVTLSTIHHEKERIGNVDIPLGDVVRNERTNDVYQLNNTQKGTITVELQWLSH